MGGKDEEDSSSRCGEQLKTRGMRVIDYDLETIEGLAEAAFIDFCSCADEAPYKKSTEWSTKIPKSARKISGLSPLAG
jgi:hypothetical protein